MVRPVPRNTLRSRISGHLFDAILRHELRPGDRIVEAKLARRLGVAQSTLREALQELEHKGLVTKRENHGTFVSRLTAKDVEDVYVVRLELEPLAAALAHQHWTAEHDSHLAGVLEEMKKAGEERDFEQLLKCDLAFHQYIWHVSGNKWLERALNAVCPSIFTGYLIFLFSGDTYDFAQDHEEHQTLIAAIQKGGPDEVRRIFTEMMETFRVQDVSNLRLVESKHSESASEARLAARP
ncbi:MAG: GntR family transcriptional regulator [Terriglobia bacterium]